MVKIDGENLTPYDVEKVALKKEAVAIAENSLPNIERASKFVEEIAKSDKIVYGINTGFGKLAEEIISKEHLKELQKNLILSHSAGTGAPLSEKEVRASILARANSLAKGYSGVRAEVIDKLIEILNKNIYPYVPSYGSLGASGDLAPLAHIALLLLGKGKIIRKDSLMDFSQEMSEFGFTPLAELRAKEGIALINGTSVETGIASILLTEAKHLFDVSIKSSALSIEALQGKSEAFDIKISKVRNFPESELVSKKILLETEESEFVDSVPRVQDAYSIRCIPAVYGAVLRSLVFIEENIIRELNAVTDNPIIFEGTKEVLSGGNFHGEIIAFSMDLFSMVLSEIGNITERRINRLLNHDLGGLPPFLSKEPGVNSGFMILQYTAAALVSENKILSHPASVDSIPVSADQEDHVSMGMTAVLKAKKVLDNLKRIISIELLLSAQAVDLIEKGNLGKGTQETFEKIRSVVAFAEKDREFSYDIDKIYDLIQNRVL